MAYRIRLPIQNKTSRPVTTTIHKGTVFEVADPFARVQNLVVAETKRIPLPANSDPVVVEVDAWCLNHSLPAPSGQSMRPTLFRTAIHYASQQEVWADQDARR